jgi:hypothetical protein
MNQHQRCFVEILASDGIHPRVELINQRTSFGRHSSCTIQIGLDNLHVSNRHAEIICDGTKIFIEDLNSTNHVFVNDEKVSKTEIKHNDIIRFGAKGPQLCFIVEHHEAVKTAPPQCPDPEIHSVHQSPDSPFVPTESAALVSGDDSILFSVAPDLDNFNSNDPVPEDTVRHEPIRNPIAHLKSYQINSGSDLVENPGGKKHSLQTTESLTQNVNQHDSLNNDQSQGQKDIKGINDLFDVSPKSDTRYFHEAVADKKTEKIPVKANVQNIEDIQQQDESIDNDLFDVSPDDESIEPEISFNVSNTMEISSRLQQQMMSTQDLDVLVKNSKTREKILNNKNITEQQKQVIVSVTDTYTSMKRKYFIIFGVVIALLCAGIFWFAHGYFSYKHQFSKALSLKNQVASYDKQFEKAFLEDRNDNSKLAMLYEKLQKVQIQFDSVKVKLELKDQQKIYSDTVEVFLDQIMAELNEKNYSIPQHMLERVKFYINLFTTEKRKSTELLLKRRMQYFNEIEYMFKQKSVPSILSYVAMQESLLDTNAISSAGAVGMWQFMESTGRQYNLVINGSTDERRDWRKSTIAAANYFRSLLLLFGDGRGVLLAIAAYNAGEDKIRKALSTVEDPIRDRDFWYLYRTSSILATETREYVPQVLARIIIDRNPALYGFK